MAGRVAVPPRRVVQLALVPFGCLLGLCVLEAGLQVGAVVVRSDSLPLPMSRQSATRRILCVGDSNTYGLYLKDRTQAYPQQLERRWNEAVERPRIEVLNLGYPGTNSSKLRRDLPRMLDTFRPDVVIVMVGSNDYWTAPVPVEESEEMGARIVRFVERRSRLYQLAYMLSRAFDHRQVEVIYPLGEHGGSAGVARYGDVEFQMGWTAAPNQQDYGRKLEEHLRAVADEVRDAGATPVFMTYASRMWNYGAASGFIRSAAAATGTRLVDLSAVFDPECPTEPCGEWLYPDHHPTAHGYGLIAETLVRELHGEL